MHRTEVVPKQSPVITKGGKKNAFSLRKNEKSNFKDLKTFEKYPFGYVAIETKRNDSGKGGMWMTGDREERDSHFEEDCNFLTLRTTRWNWSQWKVF